MPIENQLQKLVDEAIDRERLWINERVHEASQRILAQRLQLLGLEPEDADSEWLDRQEIEEQYGVPYWRIRDLQVSGTMYSIRRGRKVLSKREDVDALLTKVA